MNYQFPLRVDLLAISGAGIWTRRTRRAQEMNGREWGLLAQATLNFLLKAREYGFCIDLLNIIERRLYSESPFPIHRKGAKK